MLTLLRISPERVPIQPSGRMLKPLLAWRLAAEHRVGDDGPESS